MYQKCCPKKCEEKKPCKWDRKDECHCEKDDCEWEEKKCCRKCDEAGKAQLKCINGNSLSNLVTLTLPLGCCNEGYSLGSISVDSSKLCNPTTVLTISGVLSVIAALALTSSSTINIYRNCKGTKELIKSVPVTGILTALAVDTFSYTICAGDNGCCEDCANYSFFFVPGEGLEIAVGLSITNVVITALTVEKKC